MGTLCHVGPAKARILVEALEAGALDTTAPAERDDHLEPDELPHPIDDPLEGAEELVARAVARSAERDAAATPAERVVHLPSDQPIAIVHVGDPHIDDDGCDWVRLAADLDVIRRTPGMYGGLLGDVTNNWVGRLERLYAHQETTAEQAVLMWGWLLRRVPWAYALMGNHDLWNRGEHLMRLWCQTAAVRVAVAARHEARVVLRAPCGAELRIRARHDFRGGSQWNPAHALTKAARLDGGWGDVYVAGHRHTAVAVHDWTDSGRGVWALRAAGYKRHDDHAAALQLAEMPAGLASVTTVWDPSAPVHDRVEVFWSAARAAERLTQLRGRAALRTP